MSYKREDEYAAVFALTNLVHGSEAPSSAPAGSSNEDDDSEPESIGVREPNTKFPLKLFDILENSQYHDIIQWLPQGSGFFFVDKKRFEIEVLPLFFKKRTKFTSFTRRLIRWGFTRVARGNLLGSYFHSLFQQGKRSLCIDLCNRLRNKKTQTKRPPSKAQVESDTCTKDESTVYISEKPAAANSPQIYHIDFQRSTNLDNNALMYAYYAHKDQELKRLLVLRLLEHKRQRLMLQSQYVHLANVQNQYRFLENVHNQQRQHAFTDYAQRAVPLIERNPPIHGQPSLSGTDAFGYRNTYGAHAA